MSQLIGLFGGTFDPVHLGHINSVNLLDKTLRFDRVHWILSARPPHKEIISASIQHRYAMLELALQDYDHFAADDCEITRKEKSYTYTTVKYFRELYPHASLCLIIGSDSFKNFDTWYRCEELIEQINLVVMHRPGYTMDGPNFLKTHRVDSAKELAQHTAGKVLLFEQSDFDVSSTRLRKELSIENPSQSNMALIQQFISQPVLDYIKQHRLYFRGINNSMNSEQVKQQVVEALDDLKGVDINVINIRDVSDFADYMVVASGTSDTHVRALARSTSDHLRKQGIKPLNIDGEDLGEWVLVDFGDVVVHVMRPEVREYYDLEKLWDEDVRNLVKQHRDEQEA